MKRFNPKFIKNAVLATAVFFIASGINHKLNAQTAYGVAPGSQITVTGTSNLHDWTMAATSFACDANLNVAGGQLKDVRSLNFVLPVKNLKSKEDLMDTRAHKALNADTYDKITFKVSDVTVVAAQKLVKVTGNLTLSGVTKAISLQANYTVAEDQSVLFKGSKSIKMSEFKIKPPTFMMGALKVGDEVTINMALKLKK
ncbi:hypothetical protein BCY91_02430 [Pelobium manganitolerans]|uniref:Lipid/polyisoprenoid-binding YceI-like domain-containing protein n=1 Tax=Pelobium manganitolerans TaxID=1842495 RepID=A0A419S6S5_9SPHI|nr:YceI family protein [Pelobium manganitolerans]RKD17028.1 hypothetical protein BCY91_02430 [Pelobium manganitolerans]